MHTLSDKVKATSRPAAWAISTASQHRRARPLRAPQIAFEVEDRGRRDQLLRRAPRRVSSWLAPGQVFIVRCASGVTRIRQRPVGGPPISGGVSNRTPSAVHVMREDLAELVVGDLADEGRACRPSAAIPAMVLAADPPLISRAGPIAA